MSRSVLAICVLVLLCACTSARLTSKLEQSGRTRQLWNIRSISQWWQPYKSLALTYNNQSGNFMLNGVFAQTGSTFPTIQNRNLLPIFNSVDNFVVADSSSSFETYSGFTFTSNNQRTGFSAYNMIGSGTGGNAPIAVPFSDGSMMTVGAASVNSASYGANANFVQVNQMTSSLHEDFGDNAYGGIGFGVSNLAANGGYDTFSVYIDKYTKNGSIIMGKDLSYSRDLISTATWTTNGSWVTTGNIQLQLGSNTVSTGSYNLQIDANVNTTGFPQDVYFTILNGLKAYGVFCPTTGVYSRPTCQYNGKVRHLPNLWFTNIGGTNSWFGRQTFYIPPEVYVSGAQTFNGVASSITLNFKILSQGYQDDNFISSAVHTNDIVLDSSILSYYLAVFEAESNGSGTVSFYVASGSTYVWFYYNWPRWCKIIFIVFITLIVILLLAVCGKRKRQQKLNQ